MKSPFKFLDAYTRKDSKYFFGREEEIKRLYEMVFETPLILIYGFSGTGKTSLVQCGLASKFDGPDWFPFFIRRNDNFNVSLHDLLDTYIDKNKLKKRMSLSDKISHINTTYFRPVYLIFDQFEELFIIGNEKERKVEQEEFIKAIKDLLDAKISCRVIFIIREEYLGHLYDFEKTIPYIFNHRLRVEPMSREKVKKVLTNSFEEFGIGLESPEEEVQEEILEEIIDNISVENARIQLPYLQVYLDGLYKDGYERTYGEEGHNPNKMKGEFPPITFTHQEIKDFGTIENVLEDFLAEEEEKIYRKLKEKKYRITKTTIPTILDALVTSEGTKLPISFDKSSRGNLNPVTKNFKEKIKHNKLPANALSACITELARRRIIRFTDNTTFELAHDSIANIIDQNRTEEDRRINRVHRVLVNTYGGGEYQKHKVFLTSEQLEEYKESISLLISKKKIGDKIIQFIEDSKLEVERRNKEQEEKQRKEKEIQKIKEEKGKKEKEIKSERTRKIRAMIFAIIASVLALFAGWHFFQANYQTFEAIKSKYKYQVGVANTQKAKGDYSGAIAASITAVLDVQDSLNQSLIFKSFFWDLSELEPPIDSLEQSKKRWNVVDSLLFLVNGHLNEYNTKSDSAGKVDTVLIDVLQLYLAAYNLDKEQYLCDKINNLGQLILESKKRWKSINKVFSTPDENIYSLPKNKIMIDSLIEQTNFMIHKLNEADTLIKKNKLGSLPKICNLSPHNE